jgi:hypothetical protein
MRFVRIPALYRRHFREYRRERLFLASLSFVLAFAITRVITHAMRAGVHGLRSVWVGDTHVHHLVWGILLLLGSGYGWLIRPGPETGNASLKSGRALAVLYGVGAALTLDEFALWLNLRDVYWDREGRASIDAVALFAGLISVGLWGKPFFRAAGRQVMRPFRRR